jgi:hypothetical protein
MANSFLRNQEGLVMNLPSPSFLAKVNNHRLSNSWVW